MSVEERNIKIAEAAYAANERGDADGFTASFTPDTEIHEAESLPYGGIYKGAEGFPTVIGKVLEHFSVLKFTKHNIIASGDNVVAWGALDLTGRNTGISVTIPLIEIWTIVDGKTQKLQVVYGDTATALKAAGLV